ncbi:MAG: hypothetical protein SGJ20_19210 [Planctomycetota bacterium]|nr:hypothetical protein [Planctomycetota bacterium]
MNYDSLLAEGLTSIPVVRQFQEIFKDADHTVVKAKRDFGTEGWKIVHEWISRAPLYDRYVLWLVVPIDVGADGRLRELEGTNLYLIEICSIDGSKDDQEGRSLDYRMAEFEDGDWEQIVEAGGDLAAVGLELITNEPVERFSEFWRDTRPSPLADPGDGMAFKAPLRFMM